MRSYGTSSNGDFLFEDDDKHYYITKDYELKESTIDLWTTGFDGLPSIKTDIHYPYSDDVYKFRPDISLYEAYRTNKLTGEVIKEDNLIINGNFLRSHGLDKNIYVERDYDLLKLK